MTDRDPERRLAELEARVEMLADHVVRLAIGKLGDPRYPFQGLVVELQLPPPELARFMLALSLLARRLEGEAVTPPPGGLPGADPDVLYGTGVPEPADALALLQGVAGLAEPALVVDLLVALYNERRFEPLIEHLLGRGPDELRRV